MSFWSRVKSALSNLFNGTPDEPASTGSFTSSYLDTDLGDNGLPSGWHFVGYVDNDGNTVHIGDEITDQEIRNSDRVFIAKTFSDGTTRYRQFSSANSKDAIGDMLIRESGEGSPI